MCKKCNKEKVKTPKIPLEIIENGYRFYLFSFYPTRVGLSARYTRPGATVFITKFFKVEGEHKVTVNYFMDFKGDPVHSLPDDSKKILTSHV